LWKESYCYRSITTTTITTITIFFAPLQKGEKGQEKTGKDE
jgi:hypothetical protein